MLIPGVTELGWLCVIWCTQKSVSFLPLIDTVRLVMLLLLQLNGFGPAEWAVVGVKADLHFASWSKLHAILIKSCCRSGYLQLACLCACSCLSGESRDDEACTVRVSPGSGRAHAHRNWWVPWL